MPLAGDDELRATLRCVGELLDVDVCWYYRGSFHFTVNGDEQTVAITPESANRYRVEGCHLTVSMDRKWVSAKDRARLAALVLDAAEEQTAVTT